MSPPFRDPVTIQTEAGRLVLYSGAPCRTVVVHSALQGRLILFWLAFLKRGRDLR